MDPSKLFHVLVIGGALLGTGCLEDTPPGPTRDAAASSDAGPPLDGGAPLDAGAEIDAGTAAPVDAGPGAEPMECGICPNEACCETDESGESHTRPGLVCCWGTSC